MECYWYLCRVYLIISLVSLVITVPVDRISVRSVDDVIDYSYFDDYLDTECQAGEVQCSSVNRDLKCLKSCEVCDGKVDCLNASDERNCTCKTRLAGQYVCDNVIHCEDFSDELSCGDCLDNELRCESQDGKSSSCATISAVCEGFPCKGYERGLICRRLSMIKLDSLVTSTFRSKGYLQSYVDGNWLPVCGSAGSLTSVIVNDHCTEITGSRENHNYILDSLSENYEGLWASLENSSTVYSEIPLAYGYAVKSCTRRMVIYVECSSPQCQENIADESSNEISTRIVGGGRAHYESWRHHVAIIKDGEFQCGGSILTDRWILSASHCYMKITGSRFEVVAGSAYRSRYFPGSQRAFVSHIIRHEKFDSYTITNDIALLRLKTPLQLNKWARPTCLHRHISFSPGALCTVAGWGFTEENGTMANILQEVNIPILEVNKCIDAFTYVDTDKVVCAGDENGGKDSCQGDSGGPLMCYDCMEETNPSECLTNEWTQIGIVSYGRGCARVGVPGVYTKVEPFTDWITKTIELADRNISYLPTTVPLSSCQNFSCLGQHGLCLENASVCDGKINCFDASDEISCHQDHPSHIQGDEPDINNDAVSNQTLVCHENEEYRCSEVPQCIPYKLQCDEVRHCRDGTDELACHCVDRMYIQRPDWICDGVYDCFDLGDEFCPFCEANEWSCLTSRSCISIEKRCDARYDCKYGEDELNCVALVPNEHGALQLDTEGYPLVFQEGRVTIYSDNLWIPICSTDLAPDIADQLCSYLGFNPPIEISYQFGNMVPFDLSKNVFSRKKRLANRSRLYKHLEKYRKAAVAFIERGNSSESGIDVRSNLEWLIPYHRSVNEPGRTKRDTCSMVSLQCGARKCGMIPQLQFSDSPPLGDIANLPWAVHVTIDGEYRCGGTLIGDQWAVTSLSCLGTVNLSTMQLYVVGGAQRDTGGSRILSSREVGFRVDVAVPVDSTDLMLLHLEDSISPYSYLSWLCLNESKVDNAVWSECVFAGRYRDKFAYQLLVMQNRTEDCPDDGFCTKFHSMDDMCLNKWSGLLSCRTSRTEDSIWYAAAIWRYDNEQQCTQPKIHLKLDSKIVNDIEKLLEMEHPIAPQLDCEGHSCALGVCAPLTAICDATVDCADLTDEPQGCKVPVKMCTVLQDDVCVCEPGYFACFDHICIEDFKVCNGISDCARNEDEVDCECSLKLKSSFKVGLCDGIIDCQDQTDERYCGCDEKFRCYNSPTNVSNNKPVCLNVDNVCDTVDDCSRGEDEEHCVALTTTIYAEEDALGRPASNYEGYLIVKYVGEWFTVLFDDWNSDHSDYVCKKLKFKGSNQTIGKPLNISAISQFSRNVPPITIDYRVAEDSRANVVTYIICDQ